MERCRAKVCFRCGPEKRGRENQRPDPSDGHQDSCNKGWSPDVVGKSVVGGATRKGPWTRPMGIDIRATGGGRRGSCKTA